jgi:hypothetical protein
VINWRNPSSAPCDGSYFALINSHGEIERCTFDSEEQGGVFVISSISNDDKRTARTLVGFMGWAKWSEIFIHIKDTSHQMDRQELLVARGIASIALKPLNTIANSQSSEWVKNRILGAANAIERLLKLLPRGD